MNNIEALAASAGIGVMIFSIIVMLLGLVAMVFGIIMFCKVWRMTNDVHKMKEMMERREAAQATPFRRFASGAHPESSTRSDESGNGSEPYWKDHSRYAPPGA